MAADRPRLAAIDHYIEALFVAPDPALADNLRRAEAAGLPAIQVSPSQARASLAAAVSGIEADVRVGPAADLLREMAERGEAPFDVVFIDADKPGYEAYLALVMPLVRVGPLILADNVIRDGQVMDDPPPDDNARGAGAFNRALAAHLRLESIIVPMLRHTVDGLSISLVVR